MTRRIRILILSSYYCDYDDPWFRIRLLTSKALQGRGDMDVTIIGPSKSGDYSDRTGEDGLREIRTPGLFPSGLRRGGFSFVDTVVKCMHVLRNRYEIIHTDLSHRPASVIPAWLGRRWVGVVSVCELWEWFGRGGIADARVGGIQKLVVAYDSRMELPAIRRYSGVIAITSTLRERLAGTRLYHVTRVLHGGAEIDGLTNHEIGDARDALGLSSRDTIIGMVNLCEEDEDDNKLFLDEFATLAAGHPGLKLMVTGKPGYINDRFLTVFSNPERVIYPGWVDRNMYNLFLSSCDFFVLPLKANLRNASRWPNKIGDYFAVDRPVLASPVGDLPKVFAKHALGHLCGEGDKEFAAAAESWITDPQSNKPPVGGPLDYARSELAFPRRVEKIAEFYLELLEQG